MDISNRTEKWVETSRGYKLASGSVGAHGGSLPLRVRARAFDRLSREELEHSSLAEGATFSIGAGTRIRPEEPDPMRTAFERDRDRILHSSAFRRLAGKTQVFIFPSDHERTRLTHALEVAQVASAISQSIGLNVALTEAIAFGHDCGHGPGGHASEDAFSKFLDEGYDHATWGADHTLLRLNLCRETLDGVRNHSWSRPQPITPEGVVVSFADRIAYCAHDLEDATKAGIVEASDIPVSVREAAGNTRARQLSYFISDLVETASSKYEIALSPSAASVLADLREFNYERIYMRPESMDQSRIVIELLSALVEYFIEHPDKIPESPSSEFAHDTSSMISRSVGYVSGMTDRFAFTKAVELLGYNRSKLPRAVDPIARLSF